MITCEIVNQKDILLFHANGKIETIRDFQPYFYDDKKNKVIAQQPNDVRDMRKNYPITFEADVPYLQRFLIDRIKIPMPKEDIRINYLDIETLMSIDDENTPEPILSICCYDTKLKKYITFTWKGESKKTEEWSIYACKSEEDMLVLFLDFIKKTNPDLITGWHVYYDVKYLFNRMLKLKIDANKLCRFGQGYIGKGEEYDIRLKGRIVFDLKNAYKKLAFTQLESFSLEFVAQKELGRGKIKNEQSIGEMWENDVQKLLDYNLEDVKLIVELDKKISIINYFDELRRMVGCPWSMLEQNSMIIDTLVLRKAKERGIILPTKIRHTQEEPIEGAYVHSPTSGVYKNVIVFDMKSLYPSIIVSCNIGGESYDKNGDIDIGNGHRFKSTPEGLIPSVIKDLFELRKKYKEEMKKYPYNTSEYHSYYLKQYAVKCVLNSAYGAQGYPGFRLYKREAAESVTYMGREVIKFVIKKIEEKGYKIQASDTDSIFIQANEKELQNVVKEAQTIQKHINDSFEEFTKQKGIKKHVLFLEFEKVFSKIYFSSAKKRYVGYLCYKDGKELADILSVTGFELVRSDTPKAGKRIQEKVFRMLLDEKTQEDIEKYITIEKEEMMKNTKYDEIGIPKSVSRKFEDYKNLPIHVRAIKYSMDNLGITFDPMEKVKWAYVISPPNKPKTNVVGFYDKFPEDFKIDWNKQMPLIIDNNVERIYEALGWKAKTSQQKLDEWI